MNTWGSRPVIFEKNFVILKFHVWGNLITDTGDILILNLVTRRSFWMRNTTIKTQIKEKALGRIDFEDLWITRAHAYHMIVESERLVVQYSIHMSGESRAAILG